MRFTLSGFLAATDRVEADLDGTPSVTHSVCLAEARLGLLDLGDERPDARCPWLPKGTCGTKAAG